MKHSSEFAAWGTESVCGGKEKRLGPCGGSAICRSAELSGAGAGNRRAAHAEPGLGVHRTCGSTTPRLGAPVEVQPRERGWGSSSRAGSEPHSSAPHLVWPSQHPKKQF